MTPVDAILHGERSRSSKEAPLDLLTCESEPAAKDGCRSAVDDGRDVVPILCVSGIVYYVYGLTDTPPEI